MIAVLLVYFGLIAVFFSALALVKPIARIGLGTRRRAAVLFLSGVLLVLMGFALPSPEQRLAVSVTHLDEFAPVWQFRELHQVRVRAPRVRAYRAIREVRADEILFFRTLTAIRRLGRPGPESILNAPEKIPLLDVAMRTTFLLLAEEPGREIVLGTVVAAPTGWRRSAAPTPADFQALTAAGFALATINFRVEDSGPNECVVHTETRVFATDDSTRRHFAIYWRVIYPGSALIRRMWLRAIRLRAEAPPS